ncbi:MAG: GMC oxidoreductase [Deltaproteobacteria bacterium]|nr:GMC oxidoreductase [Deltaproteobacteria bacterium]
MHAWCAYNRKQSMLITNIPKALSRGAKLMPHVKAEEIIVEKGRAVGVRGVRYENGRAAERIAVTADRVVVSAGSVQSAVLFLKSGITPETVGRTLHIHPAAPVGAYFSDPVEAWHGTPQTYLSHQFATFYETGYGGFLLMAQSGHPGITGTMVPGMGEEFAGRMRRYPYLAAGSGMVHDETNGLVELKSDGDFKISYWPDDHDARAIVEGAKRCAEAYLAAGATEVFLPTPRAVSVKSASDLPLFDAIDFAPFNISIAAVHPQSTIPMGEDRRRCAVDSYGQSHAVRGLYAADMSVFPTSVGVPPQITTGTLAVRTADYLFEDMRSA